MTARGGGDRWLFLTPEPEAELPDLVGRMAAALPGEPPPAVSDALLDELVRDGDFAAWVAQLRAVRELVERYAAVAPAADPLLARALDVLENHHLLALTVPDPDGRVAFERGAVLELAARAHGAV